MQKILILDFGSQYTQLIARRVREINIYCEIHPFDKVPDLSEYSGVILSGSPSSVRSADAPQIDLSDIKGKMPLLGVCYGAQYLAQHFGGSVAPSEKREYGRAMLSVKDAENPLLKGVSPLTQVWMSHGDTITRRPDGCKIIASTQDVEVAAFQIEGEKTWGIQFHPESVLTPQGRTIIDNWLKL